MMTTPTHGMVLVTGSSGTIGSRLCETMLSRSMPFQGIDLVPNKWLPSVQKHATMHDLTKPLSLDARPNTIVHLAANARVYELVERPQGALDNLTMLFHMLEWARQHDVSRFVFASSREVYGNKHPEPYQEDDVLLDSESPYAATKLAGESLVHSYAKCYGLKSVIVRFSNVYGRYDDTIRLVPRFTRLALQNKPLEVYGKDKALDFTYIDDAVDGILRILDKFPTGETFNIATGKATSLLTVAELVKKHTNSSSEIKIGQSRSGEVIQYIADISKAKKLLGYQPHTSVEAGIPQAVEWFKAAVKG